MKKKKITSFIFLIMILGLINITSANEIYEIDKPIFQNEKYIFLKTENYLLVFNKWEPLWYVFPFKEDIHIIKHVKESDFLINGDEVVFSKFKGLLFYKKSKKTILGKIVRDFKINSSFGPVEHNKWIIKLKEKDLTINFYWKSENVKYTFYFKID